ncbi:MAG: ribosome small subunit-dependent GTPase A [Planctomycetota bacterium]|nr:MAG: ribosome small subunit-dependent GTPase A [Planctomycetota bacterium]
MNQNQNNPKRKQQINFVDEDGQNLNVADEPDKQSHYRRKKNKKELLLSETDTINTENLTQCLIVEVSRKNAKVLIEDDIKDCVIGGQFKEKTESLIATGDQVLVEKIDENNWVIRRILERKTKLSRPAAKGTKLSLVKEKVIAANIDVICIVVSTLKPAFKPALIDRFLLTAEKNGVSVIIIMNKMDLVDSPPKDIFEYEKLGIKVIYTIATEQKGIKEIKETLSNKIAVFTGHSGVGKSSILNAVSPELNLKTQDVGDGKHCWRHTTRKSTLYLMDNGGMIIDTPGIRELGVWDIKPEELSWYFPEFHEPAEQCKFSNCTHDHEPQCNVKDLVEAGQISSLRYNSYLRVFESLKEDQNKVY